MDKKIMVVDDDPDILVSMRTIFERQGYEVFTVDNGSDCIEELEQGFKGIVLMDLIMPFMDGLETLREIIKKRLNKDIVFSIITANGIPDSDKLKGLEQYIYNYIKKPFDLEKLITDINSINV
ncbi:MAG: response regulator [Thermoplasmatales archaeon]|nr:MAG: response regulator [Thermoplasmatales archaeon]